MRNFIDGLDGIQKEDFKDFLQMRGARFLIEWIVTMKIACKERAISAANWEEVLASKGEVMGYNNVLSFLEDATKSLQNFKAEE